MIRRPTLASALCTVILTVASVWPISQPATNTTSKLDDALRGRLETAGMSNVIVRATRIARAETLVADAGGVPERRLGAAGGFAARIPNRALGTLVTNDDILAVSLDRQVSGALDRAALQSVGAAWVAENLGLDGSGIGVATIDSGVTAQHDDLDPARIVHWVDFVNRGPMAYDDYGHGTHVAGIIAGNGATSSGSRRGVAPGVNLIVLKALDATGSGRTSDVIAAVDYAIAVRDAFNIRVLNLSVAAGVYESYDRDPLTLAARRAVEAGITVVAAAGNFGTDAQGEPQYGGITAPGNAPWVLTVGAADTRGTPDRDDDVVAAFSSRGPSAVDGAAKPDLVAPGVAVEAMADSASALFALHPRGRLWGSMPTVSEPYLSLTGTSMAAPIVAGTAALMLQANPSLTPNAVKAILQYTAEPRTNVDEQSQGAGLLNARGAVALARQLAIDPADGSALESAAGRTSAWSRRIIWGAEHVTGAAFAETVPAWKPGVVWGTARTADGGSLSWSPMCSVEAGGCASVRRTAGPLAGGGLGR